MKKFLTLCLALLLIFSVVGCKLGQKEIKMRLAETHPADYPTTQGDYEFAKLVKERSNGKITIEVYHSKQLGEEKAVIEQVQLGAIDFTRVSLAPVASFDAKFNALQMPFLYRDTDHLWKVLNGNIGDELLAGLEKSDFIGIGWFDGGIRNFYTKRLVKTPKDLKGMKIRVQQSELMVDMVKALGATATPLPYGEVYSALQTGVVDGAENNYPSYDSTSHYEVAKFLVEDEHLRIPEIIIASKKALNSKLSKKEIEMVKQAARDAQTLQIKLWNEKVTASKEKVKAAKCVITELSADEKKAFQDAMSPVYDKQADDIKAIIKKVQEIQ